MAQSTGSGRQLHQRKANKMGTIGNAVTWFCIACLTRRRAPLLAASLQGILASWETSVDLYVWGEERTRGQSNKTNQIRCSGSKLNVKLLKNNHFKNQRLIVLMQKAMLYFSDRNTFSITMTQFSRVGRFYLLFVLLFRDNMRFGSQPTHLSLASCSCHHCVVIRSLVQFGRPSRVVRTVEISKLSNLCHARS